MLTLPNAAPPPKEKTPDRTRSGASKPIRALGGETEETLDERELFPRDFRSQRESFGEKPQSEADSVNPPQIRSREHSEKCYWYFRGNMG